MKQAINTLSANLFPLFCVGLSAYLCLHGIGYWGWYFAGGMIIALVVNGQVKKEQ